MTLEKSELVIILVAPQMGENIGAVARAMGNFGLCDLRIIHPRDGWPNAAAEAMAAHAKPIIAKAQIFDSVEQAIADCHFVLAATARQRDMQKPHLTPDKWCKNKDKMTEKGKTALLFGRENNGLSNEEIALAHAIISIPVHPDCPSLNLAQSAAILCYEWFQHTAPPLDYIAEPAAAQNELQAFFTQLEQNLDASNFWKVDAKKPKMWRNIRNFFLRSHPTSQELHTLHGIITALRQH